MKIINKIRLAVAIVHLLTFQTIFSQEKQGVSRVESNVRTSIEYVDLFIGTSGDHGQLDPAACVPFGMVKLGPDTDPGNHSGYDYKATKIKGFSHNRIGGVGCKGAGGNLRILPSLGEEQNSISFDKRTEKAFPGYYAVQFNNKIEAELTATNQTGFHKYTFPVSDDAHLRVDIKSSFAGTIKAIKQIINANEFFVEVSAKNVCGVGRYTVYYHVWCSKSIQNNQEEEDGNFSIHFNTKKNEEVLLQVTASTISAEDAREEWIAMTKKLKFEEVKQKAKAEWQKLLSKIEVEGKEEYKTIFYSHLYHQFLNPVKTENRLGQFRATDGSIQKADNYVHYDSWSMWDNFRNKFSLYALVIPDTSNDIAKSLVDLYRFGKANWSGYHEPVPTVRTEHSIVTLLDLYQRGITDFDLSVPYFKLSAEITNTYNKTPDTKLEHSYDLWALYNIADILNLEDDKRLYKQEYLSYKSVWRAKFLNISDKFDIMHGDGLYEGTLWQYRWHAHYDVDGMVDMLGSKALYTEQLEYFFDNHLYNHGNQPDIHVPWMFNYSNKPWLTQKWVNQILTKEMEQHYGTHGKW
nr:glycoside hydrolase domain-containing protein [Maribacter luteus]